MFSRRKPTSDRVFKKPLFKFDGSRHAISISSYMREQRDLELTGGVAGVLSSVAPHGFEQDQPSIAQHLVCKPDHRNVTGKHQEEVVQYFGVKWVWFLAIVVFRAVKDFVDVVERELGLKDG